jgi:hypothetical protein
VNISYRTVIRLGAVAAMTAGILRAGTSFNAYSASGVAVEVLYLAIDLLLLFALVAIYAYVRERSGWLGLAGFVLALAGTSCIVGPDGTLGGVDMYVAGATTLSIGLAVLSVGAWRATALPRAVCALWIGSTLIGVGGHVVQGLGATFTMAGLAFGVGFFLAGLKMWREPVPEGMGDT